MSGSSHILIVDDDRRIRELLATYLSSHGFRTTAAASAKDARDHMRGLAFDLVVLDVMMPGETGTSLAETVRKNHNDVPILMLSARTDASDRIKGLASGSDDYLGKPFEPEELLLRVHSLLRRSAKSEAEIREAHFGDCVFEMGTGELWNSGARVRLTGREKDMLRVLVQNAGRAVARAALNAPGVDESARAVDVQINRLRQKIEADPANPVYLQTVRGEGYCLHIASVDAHEQ